MTMLVVGVHDAVAPHIRLRLPTPTSAVCRCGAVYDYGNIVVPLEYRALCGRCAAAQANRPHVGATPVG